MLLEPRNKMQLDRLPSDLIPVIMAYAAYSFQDIINMRVVSQDFNRLLSFAIENFTERFTQVKALLQQERINLRDPLYYGFTPKLPYSQELDREKLAILRFEHYNNILTSKQTAHGQVDRFFGYLFENPELFDRLFELKNSLVNYIIGRVTCDEYFYKFLELPPGLNIQTEKSFVGISHYHQKYSSRENGKSHREQLELRFESYQRNLPFTAKLNIRIHKAMFMINLSRKVDFLLFEMAQFLILYASGFPAMNNFLINLLTAILATTLSLFLQARVSLIWPVFHKLDLILQNDPIAAENFKKLLLVFGHSVVWLLEAVRSIVSLIIQKKPTGDNRGALPILFFDEL